MIGLERAGLSEKSDVRAPDDSLLALWRDGWRRSREVRELALRQR